MVDVTNLNTGNSRTYSCTPREAVIASYAQVEKKDFNTWDYSERYDHLVKVGISHVTCGYWTAPMEAIDG